jgi:hypothetical protein
MFTASAAAGDAAAAWNFAVLNASATAFVVTAVEVVTGTLTPFANKPIGKVSAIKIEPRHVLASGSRRRASLDRDRRHALLGQRLVDHTARPRHRRLQHRCRR